MSEGAAAEPRRLVSAGELLAYQRMVAFEARLARRRRISYWLLIPWVLASVGMFVGVNMSGLPWRDPAYWIIAGSWLVMISIQWVPPEVVIALLERRRRTGLDR